MRLPLLIPALLLSASLWAQLPFSFFGSAGGDCVPQIHNETWPGTADPTGSVQFNWSATNTTNVPVLMEVSIYRDQYYLPGPVQVDENLEFSFTFTAAPNGTSSGAVFWTCPINSFEELLAHSVRVSGPSGTCTAFSMTVGYVVPAFGNDSEPNEDPSSQPFSTVNIDYDGHLRTNNATDDDWYRIQLPAQGKLLITLQSETPGSTPGTIEAQLIYTTSTLVSTWSGPTGTDNVSNTNVFEQTCAGNANGGIYYLGIRATGACDVSYRMTLTLVAPAFTNDIEPNNSTGEAIALPETQTADGHLYFQHGDNLDIYRTDLSSDGLMHIAIEAEQAGTSTTGTLQVILFTSNSTVLETWNIPVGANSIPISTALSNRCLGNTSPYYLQLISSDCGTSYRISYSVTPPLFAQDPEPNNSTSQPIPLPETQTADGHLNFYFGDNLDIYRLDLTTDGVLNVTIEAEHADLSTIETVAAGLSVSTGAVIATWNVAVGASSISTSTSFSLSCLGTNNSYYLNLISNVCGVSYRVSWTVTAPVYANDPEPNNGGPGTPMDLNTGEQQGHIGFYNLGDPDYFGFTHPGGPWSVTVSAEHAGTGAGTLTMIVAHSTGTVYGTFTVPVGGSSTAAMNTFSIPDLPASANYYLIMQEVTCGVSYMIHCNFDDDGDGICNIDDLCPSGPEPGTACDDGNPGTINDEINALCECVGDLSTGLEEAEGSEGLRAWPNPAHTALFLSTAVDAVVYDAQGRAVRTVRRENAIPLDDLAPGVYLLRTLDGRMIRFVRE